MQLIINGVAREVEPGLSIVELLTQLGKSIEHVAVERNGEVVELAEFSVSKLEANDRLEVVHFVGGG
jgi:thiamine biosynthesis protein ThiS